MKARPVDPGGAFDSDFILLTKAAINASDSSSKLETSIYLKALMVFMISGLHQMAHTTRYLQFRNPVFDIDRLVWLYL